MSLPPQDRHVYEVIDARRPCWAYFDLEFTRKDGLNAPSTATLTGHASATCGGGRRRRPTAGDRGDCARVGAADQVRAASSSGRTGRTASGGRRRSRLAARRPSRGRVIKALGDALTVQSGDARTTRSAVDTGVYTRDRRFRVWGATKHGDAGAAFDVTEQGVPRLPARRVYAVEAPRDAGRTKLQPGEPTASRSSARRAAAAAAVSGRRRGAAAPAALRGARAAGSWGGTAPPRRLLDARRRPRKFIIAGRGRASRRRCSPRRRRGARGAPARPPRQRRPHADVLALRRGGIPVGTVPPPHRQGPGRLEAGPAAPEPEPRRDGRPGQRPLLARATTAPLRAQRAHDEGGVCRLADHHSCRAAGTPRSTAPRCSRSKRAAKLVLFAATPAGAAGRRLARARGGLADDERLPVRAAKCA